VVSNAVFGLKNCQSGPAADESGMVVVGPAFTGAVPTGPFETGAAVEVGATEGVAAVVVGA
jgi:hypothetical protein